VGGAGVYLDGAASPAATSDADGTYQIAGVTAGSHTIEPRKHGERFNGVSALDAAYVLQFVANRRTLDAGQQLACDVTANGALSALDATRIFQFAVGSLPQFAAATACDSDWIFAPHPAAGAQVIAPAFTGGNCQRGAINSTVGSDMAGLDFDALLIGDCTGNWQPPAAGAAALQRVAGSPAAVVRVRRRAGGGLRIALLVRGDTPFSALEAALTIARADMRVVAARPSLAAR